MLADGGIPAGIRRSIEVSKHEEAEMRYVACRSLGAIGRHADPDDKELARQRLLEMATSDPIEWVRRAAKNLALAQLAGEFDGVEEAAWSYPDRPKDLSAADEYYLRRG